MKPERQGPRYYIPHHLIFYPVIGLLSFICFYNMNNDVQTKYAWLMIGLCFLSVTALALMMRQHYALGNQDRIIKLEMRYRYFATTGKRFEPSERLLTFKQIAALRFASDEELMELVHKAVEQKLSPSQIKSLVKVWIADDMRL